MIMGPRILAQELLGAGVVSQRLATFVQVLSFVAVVAMGAMIVLWTVGV
jgi:hypothetical protein